MTHLEVLGNLTNKPLEGQLADEELRRLLVPTDFTEGDSTRPETMRLLDTTGGGLHALQRVRGAKGYTTMQTTHRGRLTSLSCELLTRGLATSGLASGLLGTGHR